MKNIKKIVILGDSQALPRAFPENEITFPEETYISLLTREYKDAIIWQNIMSNETTEKVLSIAISYISGWKPDLIILASGLHDARPEGLSQKSLKYISNVLLPLKIYDKLFKPNRSIYKFVLNVFSSKHIISFFNRYKTTPRQFKRTLIRLNNVFSDSKIFPLEIICSKEYENLRPGVIKRVKEYNKILKDIYKGNVIPLQEQIEKVLGFNSDGMHLNKNGHAIIYSSIKNKISD